MFYMIKAYGWRWSKNQIEIQRMLGQNGPGTHFTNNFFITIQMRWKFHFTLIQIFMKWSLQNFSHDTTAVLSWHVQNFLWYHNNWITTKWNFHRIWIVIEKSLMKCVPESRLTIHWHWQWHAIHGTTVGRTLWYSPSHWNDTKIRHW